MVSFIFGGNTNETPETLKRKREMIEALMIGQTPKNTGEGVGAVLKGITAGVLRHRANSAETAGRASGDSVFNKIFSGITGGVSPDQMTGGNIPMSDAGAELASTTPGATPDMTGNDVYSGFMDTVKTQVKNPFALSAIAATGNAESKFSPGNVNRTWSDPSESGQAGTAGGIMSWRGPRYEALAATGDLSPQGQAKYFLQEDPKLIERLNSAKSVEEAQSLMNNAWKFAGYNRQGGEAQRRMNLARSYLPSFQGGGETAALTAGDAINAISPQTGGNIPMGADPIMQANMAQPSLADEVAAFQQTPEYSARFPGMRQQGQFDPGRFGGADLSAAPVVGQQGLASALATSNQGGFAGQQAIGNQTGGMTQQLQGSQQMADASGGMMPALNGGQPATAEQIAQAQAMGQQQGGQQAQGMSGPSLQDLYKAAANPWLAPEQKAVVGMLIQQKLQEQQTVSGEQQWRSRQDYEQQMKQRDPAYALEQQYRQAQIEKLNREAAGGGTPELGLNPQYGIDKDGNPVLIQIGKDGRAVQTALPDGVSLSKEPIKLDAGSHFVLLDPITRQPVGQIPKDLAGAERDKAAGKNLADARAGLPQIEASSGELLASIGSLESDPYLNSMVGPVDSRLPNFSADAARVQSKMDQIGGQSFLQAFNMLRGSGQITEQEGAKATAAMARLATAQNEKDYREALGELRGVVERAVTNARRKAGGESGQQMGGNGTAGAQPAEAGAAIQQARDAIARGANRAAVMQRLQQMGINPEGL